MMILSIDKSSITPLVTLLHKLHTVEPQLIADVVALFDGETSEEVECEVIHTIKALKAWRHDRTKNEETMRRHRSQRPVRIYMDGVFDLMHSGHYNAFRQARKMGDVLVAGIDADVEVEAAKGATPIYTMEERRELVAGCKWVDEVVVDMPYSTTVSTLDAVGCVYCAHGDDIAINAQGEDAYGALRKAGRMRVFKRTEGISSSCLISRLLAATALGASCCNPHVKVEEPQKVERWLQAHPTPRTPAVSPVASSVNRFVRDASEEEECGESTPSTHAATPNPFTPLRRRLDSDGEESTESVSAPSYSNDDQSSDDNGSRRTPEVQLFLSTQRLRQFIGEPRKAGPGDRVVYVDGSFDLFHVGHLRLLQKAKTYGDFLIVGVHDDATVRHFKGPHFPIMNMLERALCALAMRVVDDVVLGAPLKVSEYLMSSFNIDVVVAGLCDDEATKCKSDYSDPERLGKLVHIESGSVLTTTKIMKRIKKKRDVLLAAIGKRIVKEENFCLNLTRREAQVEL